MHVTLQTFSVNPAEVVSAQSASSLVNNSPEILQDLNLVFSGSIVFIACGHQYNRCAGLGEVAGGPPKEEELKQHHLNRGRSPRNTRPLFVKRCTTPLCLCRQITAQKLLFTQESSFLGIHLKPPSSPDSWRWARGGFSDTR